MKKPLLYTVLFGVPGFLLAVAVAFLVSGLTAGFLWLFVFGDEPWPAAASKTLGVLFMVVFLVVWSTTLVMGYHTGRKLKPDSPINRTHLVFSAVLTLVLVVMMLLHQWGVGNIGPKPDTLRCSDYCRQSGYPGSGMPPRDSGDSTCICYDESGGEALKTPLSQITDQDRK